MAEHLLDSICDLPARMKSGLAAIGDSDKETKRIATDISNDQKKLLNDMANMAKGAEPTNYEYIADMNASIKKRRIEVNAHMEAQTKKAKIVYDEIDVVITKLDEKINNLNSLLDAAAMGSLEGEKKKGKLTAGEESALVDASKSRFSLANEDVDPNEPVYCYCKKVSFGQMVGCANDDCPIAWYHYECVGIPPDEPEENLDNWLCPECTDEA